LEKFFSLGIAFSRHTFAQTHKCLLFDGKALRIKRSHEFGAREIMRKLNARLSAASSLVLLVLTGCAASPLGRVECRRLAGGRNRKARKHATPRAK
jgi:hypothetical protein